jgi:hypothetical protein
LQISVLAGTVFQDTKKPLQLWFRAIWHVTNQKYGQTALSYANREEHKDVAELLRKHGAVD